MYSGKKALHLSTKMYRVFLFDCETSGLDYARHCIMEMAILRYSLHTSVEHMCALSTKVHCCCDVEPEAFAIHGIAISDTRKAPTFQGAWARVMNYVNSWTGSDETVVLVAHNAVFDMRFLLWELSRNDLRIPDWQYTCSLKLSREVWQGTSCTLTNLARAAGVHHAFLGQAHRASTDVKLVSKVLYQIAMIMRYNEPTMLKFIGERASRITCQMQ